MPTPPDYEEKVRENESESDEAILRLFNSDTDEDIFLYLSYFFIVIVAQFWRERK